MLTFALMQQDEINQVAEFISIRNRVEENHIGYCGKDTSEIAQYIKEEIPYTNSFVTAYSKGQLVGVIGFDPDIESGVAEVWGPFIEEDHLSIVDELWEEMMRILPNDISSLHMFPNKKNRTAYKIGEKYKFTKHTDQAILVFNNSDTRLLVESPLEELTPEYYSEMEKP
ncbi:hypothetical protein [Ornithinibacillus californiensis]|uniref:hypothetical protein n=1 Tax=Ornithinibacillus californiensis TaxID=161536 RepID=UPI001F41B61E|nr:hypothetical protein [Ornithinibacillus californiensis]